MREKWIDNAKGLAILLVIVGHVGGNLRGFSFNFVYGFHLVVFFVISGYTMKEKPLRIEYVNQKFSRLMMPYFYTCFAILVMDCFNSWHLLHDTSIASITGIISRDLTRSFFASGVITTFGTVELGTRIGAIWLLPALFFAVCIFQLLLHIIKKDWVLGAVTGAIALLSSISARFIWLPFSIQSGLFALFYLWIGYEIKKYAILSKVKWYHYLAALFIFLLGVNRGVANVGFAMAQSADVVLSTVVGLAGALLVYLVSIADKKGKILEQIGKNSLYVLCAHLFALETMEHYFVRMTEVLGLTGNYRELFFIFEEIIFAVCAPILLKVLLQGLRRLSSLFDKKTNVHAAVSLSKGTINQSPKRDSTIDICKGIFIILMIVGHFPIDSTLKKTIYSCHMMAFVFFSGYFYNKNRSILKTIQQIAKTLLVPYCIFIPVSIMIDIVTKQNVESKLYYFGGYFVGMFSTKKILTQFWSVGPVYFILLLAITRLIYVCLDHLVKNQLLKMLAVLFISMAGVVLGEKGYWLPWSADVACYALVFYYIGTLCREKDILNIIKNRYALYFVLSPIWVYMIYCGSMDIALRNFGQYGLVIVGSLCGILLFYQASVFISDKSTVLAGILEKAGRSTMIILIIHRLLGGHINKFVENTLHRNNTVYMLVSTVLQITIAIIIAYIVQQMKYVWKKRRAKNEPI